MCVKNYKSISSRFFPSDLSFMPADDKRMVEGLSVDWISRTLYFTNYVRRTLEIMHLDFPDQQRILLNHLGGPRSVVVHPARG